MCIHCKSHICQSLWIKASAKRLNVNVIINVFTLILVSSVRLRDAELLHHSHTHTHCRSLVAMCFPHIIHILLNKDTQSLSNTHTHPPTGLPPPSYYNNT